MPKGKNVLLAIRDIFVNEKVYQLKTLLTEGWVKINSSKCGLVGPKTYLEKQGEQTLKSKQKGFDLLYFFKEDSYYIFNSQLDHNKSIRKYQITKAINKIMGLVSKNLTDQPNLKNHSFRISFIIYYSVMERHK